MSLAAEIEQRWKGLLPELLGIRFEEVTQNKVVAALIVRPELCTVGGVLHGGAIMAFADTLGAVGTLINMPQGARTTTIESKTNFLSAAPVNARVVGESTPVHLGRTTMVWQTKVSTEAGKLVALVTQTQMVLPRPG